MLVLSRRLLLGFGPAIFLFLACGDDDATPSATPAADGGTTSSSGSSTSSSGATSSSSGSAGADCAAIANAACAYGARCLAGLLEATHCEELDTLLCQHQQKLPGYTTTPLPRSCVDTLANAACTAAQAPAGLSSPECLRKGALDNGAGCEKDEQCKSGTCFAKSTAACGVCADPAAEGADCTKAKCAPSLVCLGTKTAGEMKCKHYDALGADCTLGSCAFPNRCVGGKCVAPLDDGADCTHPTTDDNPCLHSCLTDKKCGPSPNVFVKAGEKCEGFSLICPAGTSCHGPAGDQRCVLDVLAGAACSDTDGPECAPSLACVNGKCEERPLDACK